MATRRVTARVLPVSPDGAVLLLHEQDPVRPGQLYWSSIGGGVDAGETHLEAAVREMAEETGLVVDPGDLVGPVRVHQQAYSWGGVDYDGEHTYFALPLTRAAEVVFDGLEVEEVGNVLGSGWWRPDDVAAGVPCAPPALPDIMRDAVAAVVPHGGEL